MAIVMRVLPRERCPLYSVRYAGAVGRIVCGWRDPCVLEVVCNLMLLLGSSGMCR